MKDIIKLFLRLALSVGFISAVLDRFGLFWTDNLAWGNWGNFVDYTGELLPWFSPSIVQVFAIASTVVEILLALFLLIGWKIRLFANLSGVLLLLFALAMSYSTGVKTAFDASVYTASAGAFALATIKRKFLEIG